MIVTLFDGCIGGLCMYAIMRIDQIYPAKLAPNAIDVKAALTFGFVCMVTWLVFKLPRAVWRYTSLDDVLQLIRGVALVSIITPLILFVFLDPAHHFPRVAPFLVAPLFLAILLLSRILVFLYYKGDPSALFRMRPRTKRAILVGGSDTLHDHIRDRASKGLTANFEISGLIDTSGAFEGRSIRGVSVLGKTADIVTTLKSLTKSGLAPPTLIIVDPVIDRAILNDLVHHAAEANVDLVRFSADGKDGLSRFEANDLIGRQSKDLDISPVRQFVEDRKVLITGAGGTIGSELALQISRLRPSKLILIVYAEYNLYLSDQNLSHEKLCNTKGLLGDIGNETRMREIFELEQPDIVLHAAALKHVTLSELNPVEAIKTNVGGTSNIINLATEYNTDSFTLISTDKAVSPSNIMGATKRIAEMATLAAATQSPSLSACAVRFGNVLASTGSVVPLFESQIRRGGPVTVTHKDATRYFMTTQEAAALVLQASALSSMQRKEMAAVYVLDMGEPVNIDQLARQLIRLRGYVPDRDIEVAYTGLRPGEKLTELLTDSREELAKTYVDGVMRFTGRIVDPESVIRRINRLLKAAEQRDRPSMIKALSKLLPDYEPNGTLHDKV